jgi:DNA (cytosine-5)-methyltransferase 1
MGMSEASEHFGIAVPIAQRNRKSGAKKRRQYEIEMFTVCEEAIVA